MFSKSTIVAIAMLGASLVDAHTVMVEPVPYNFNPGDNSPLLESGSDFPCKTTDYSITQENYMTIGETQRMRFQGGATHGGGSCQIAITSDRAPTKDTQWSVIKSIESGCMDTEELDVNRGSTASMANPFAPEFTIPDSFAPGEYTIAFTWFNRIGNREMYMNCAPITVTGGSSAKRSDVTAVEKRAETFPPLFIANINGCKTKHNKDVRFPNPGNNVEYLGKLENLIAEGENPCDQGAPTWGDAGFSSSGGGSAPQPTVSEPAATSEPAPTSTSEPAPTIDLGVGVAPDVTAAPTQPTEVSEPATTESSTLVPAPTSDPAPSAPSSSGALSGPCTEEGIWNCIDGSSFQRCASGAWTPSQAMAAGTECTPGQSADFTVKAAPVKSRMLKEKRSHRRSHGAHARVHS